jgi:hypothetical protein
LEHPGPYSQFNERLDDVGESSKSVSADSGEPHQPPSNARKSIAEQCKKVEAMLTSALQNYPLIRKYLYTLDEPDRKIIMQVAFKKTCECAEPRIAYFLHWLIEEVLQDPNQTLNYSNFARLINVQRHEVTKRILPKALRAYADMVNEKLFCYLLIEKVSIELPE